MCNMTDLFKKINTLVKSSLNELLGDDLAIGAPRRRALAPRNLGKNIDREIDSLRQHINEAVSYETELQERVNKIHAEVAQWDAQADEAVSSGNDATARHAIEQMQRAQQRLAMAESDLREHQLVTQELIQRVNTLEAAVADARRAKQEELAEAQQQTESPTPNERSDMKPPRRILSDILRDMREKIANMGDLIATREEVIAPVEPTTDEDAIDDDLAERRQRLSKPK
jgi:phage shock protein A